MYKSSTLSSQERLSSLSRLWNQLCEIPRNRKRKESPATSRQVSKLQLSNKDTVIRDTRDSHAQEDGHSPIPKFAGDDEDRHFWFVFAGQMQLHEQ